MNTTAWTQKVERRRRLKPRMFQDRQDNHISELKHKAKPSEDMSFGDLTFKVIN